jgi:hypothetical protein
MKGPRLQPRQVHLAQPFADGSLGDRDREALRHHLAKIDTAPAHDFVLVGVWTFDHEILQLRHLLRRQRGWAPANPRRDKPSHACFVVAVDPVPQGLPVHPGLLCRGFSRMAVQDQGDGQQTPYLRGIAALRGKLSQGSRRVLRPGDLDRRNHRLPPT